MILMTCKILHQSPDKIWHRISSTEFPLDKIYLNSRTDFTPESQPYLQHTIPVDFTSKRHFTQYQLGSVLGFLWQKNKQFFDQHFTYTLCMLNKQTYFYVLTTLFLKKIIYFDELLMHHHKIYTKSFCIRCVILYQI